MKRKIMEATVYATGIKKRCRKIGHHSFVLGEVPEQEATAALLDRAVVRVNANMQKITGQVYLRLHPIELEDLGDGLVIRTYEISLGHGMATHIPLTHAFPTL